MYYLSFFSSFIYRFKYLFLRRPYFKPNVSCRGVFKVFIDIFKALFSILLHLVKVDLNSFLRFCVCQVTHLSVTKLGKICLFCDNQNSQVWISIGFVGFAVGFVQVLFILSFTKMSGVNKQYF